MQVSEAVKALRTAMALSQQKLADRLGMGINAVQRWEMGSAQPSAEAFTKLYFLAKTVDDEGSLSVNLAGVFASGGVRPVVRDESRSEAIMLDLPSLRNGLARINMSLARVQSDSTLTADERGACIGRAQVACVECEQLLDAALRKLSTEPA